MTDDDSARDAAKQQGEPEDRIESDSAERQQERRREEREYMPVIIKRVDEARRHPDDVLEFAIEGGIEQARRPVVSLALSSVAAGLILSFTAMAVGVVASMTLSLEAPEAITRLAMAVVYPLGFVLCIMSGTQLFTEHTALAVYPFLDGRIRCRSLMRLWAVVLAGNMVGAFVGAGLLAAGEGVIDAASGYELIATHLVAYSTPTLLISGVLAGWLMALGAWLMLATQPTMSQTMMIYAVTFLIGLGGLHHSIAGAVELFAGMLTGAPVSWLDAAWTLALAVVGNLLGGALFVAALNYGHIRRSRDWAIGSENDDDNNDST